MSAISQQVTTWQQWADVKAWETQETKKKRMIHLGMNHLGTVSKNILLEGLNRFNGANLTLSSDVDQDT